jgi:hypothetical protein
MTPSKPKDMKAGETPVEYLKRVRDEVDPDHPWLQGIKSGLAGADLDAYNIAGSFTSPISLATLLAGPAGKAPGALGKAARALTGAASVGFGAKGASDVYEAATDTSKDLPTRVQQGLQGAAVAVGGAAGAAESAKPTVNAVVERTKPAVRAAAKTVKKLGSPENIGTVVGGAVGAKLGHVVGEPMGLGAAGAYVGRKAGKAFGENFKAERAKSISTPESSPVAEDFREDGTSPQTESAGETPAEHVPEEEAPTKKTLADLGKSKASSESGNRRGTGNKSCSQRKDQESTGSRSFAGRIHGGKRIECCKRLQVRPSVKRIRADYPQWPALRSRRCRARGRSAI